MTKFELLEKVSKIIQNFLKSEGGYANGSMTYVRGVVSRNKYSSLEWSTPANEELTLKLIKEKGMCLNNKIRIELLKTDLNSIIIRMRHIESNMFLTEVVIEDVREIKL